MHPIQFKLKHFQCFWDNWLHSMLHPSKHHLFLYHRLLPAPFHQLGSPLPESSLTASGSPDKSFPWEAQLWLKSWVHGWQVCCTIRKDNSQNTSASLTRYTALPAASCPCERLTRPWLAVIGADIVRSSASLPETNLSFMKKCLLGQRGTPGHLIKLGGGGWGGWRDQKKGGEEKKKN